MGKVYQVASDFSSHAVFFFLLYFVGQTPKLQTAIQTSTSGRQNFEGEVTVLQCALRLEKDQTR